MAQTAVEQLEEQFKRVGLLPKTAPESHMYHSIIAKAKQMEKQQRKDDITDYNIKVTEFLLNPLFNLEHSKHGIACEKLADIRNEFINKL